jgi:DeoR/GlpR family transcriptional regulator of sugar metabolism
MITRREQEMLDLQDEGLDARAIAERMGVKEDTVRRTLNMLCVSTSAERIERAAIASSSAALLAAIRRHHPEQLLVRPGSRAATNNHQGEVQ